jgi:hypothetical protein
MRRHIDVRMSGNPFLLFFFFFALVAQIRSVHEREMDVKGESSVQYMPLILEWPLQKRCAT